MTLAGTGADEGAFCGVDPSARPGVEKLSGSLDDFEQRFPILLIAFCAPAESNRKIDDLSRQEQLTVVAT